MSEKQIKNVRQQRDRLLDCAKTLGICVLIDDEPQQGDTPLVDVGHTPFIRHDGCFYIYSSRLSAHVRALLNEAQAQFFLIEDEATAQNIWARTRLKFSAKVEELSRDDAAQFTPICDMMSQRHGPVMETIRSFTDFHLFEIRPKQGVLVTGFGQAYAVKGPSFELGEHLTKS